MPRVFTTAKAGNRSNLSNVGSKQLLGITALGIAHHAFTG